MTGALRPRLAGGLAGLTLFVGVWTWLPAPTYTLLTLSVGAPEVAVWLAVCGIAALALALPRVAPRHSNVARRWRRLALGIALLSLLPPALVLGRIPSTIRAFNASFAAAMAASPAPSPVAAASTASAAPSMLVSRPTPVTIRELFFGLRPVEARTWHRVAYPLADGSSLTMEIYRPPDDRRLPVLVQIYGGAWQRGEPIDNPSYARAMAASGVVVFALDYRHAPAFRWPTQLHDVLDGLRWIVAHAAEYGADTSRMAIVGRSSGAQLALRAALDPAAPPVHALVLHYSPVDLTSGYYNLPVPDTLDLRRIETDLIGGTPEDKPEAYRDASPITFADRPHPPVLLISGGRDHIVEPAYSATLHARLRMSGVSIYLLIPWADHGFDAVAFGPSAQIALHYGQRFLDWAWHGRGVATR